MKVNLIKVAQYDFNEEKYTAMPSEVFGMLVGEPVTPDNDSDDFPSVVIFENKQDYISNAWRHDIDPERSVYVSKKGQIFCYLKANSIELESKEDATTNTEENKGE